MKNCVIYNKKSNCDWAELVLFGEKPTLAKVSARDLPLIDGYRWGLHPRGIWDRQRSMLLTHVLFPDARRVYFRNWNRLDCRRENLFTEKEAASLRKRRVPGARGVYYDPVRCAYIAHYSSRGVQVFGYFSVKNFHSGAEAERAAVARREEFLKMSLNELVAYKEGRKISEHELWLGEDVATALTERVDDPRELAYQGFKAGLIAGRALSNRRDIANI